MRSHTTRQFRESFAALPDDIKQRAREAYRRFVADSGHPGLRFKPVQGVPGVWSARVGLGYRALATREGDDVIWYWIGPHADYDKLSSSASDEGPTWPHNSRQHLTAAA